MASDPSSDSCLIQFNQFSSSPIIDVRTVDEYQQGHWLGASHFSADTIISRLFELPKKNQPLRLCGNLAEIKKIDKKLTEKGFQIDAVVEWNLHLVEYLLEFNLLEKGEKSVRLWSPAPVVETFQKRIAQNIVGKALDIGCGAGRDSVYLASNGWQVDAVDYLPDALERLKTLAKNNSVEVSTYQVDLEKDEGNFLELLANYQLILVVRYLHRPLLPILKQKISKGGFIVYQTFMRGCEIFGSPKNPRFLLEKGELAKFFKDFDILLDEVHYLEDGRPTNLFIAQKK